jgi:hypothetical protein
MLGFLIIFGVVKEINYVFIIIIKRKNKRINVIFFFKVYC